MKKIIFPVFLMFGLAVLYSAGHASSHEFSKGKTIRLVVGNSAGGTMDD